MSEARWAPSGSSPTGERASRFLPVSQVVYSLLIFTLYLLVALLLGIFGLYALNQGQSYTLTALSLAWGTTLIGFLMLPAAILATFRLFNQSLPGWITAFFKFIDEALPFSIILWPLVIAAGVAAGSLTSLEWILMPPLNILAIALPVVWILAIGKRRLNAGSPLRQWGSLSIAVVVTPAVCFTLEIIVLLGIILLVMMLLGGNQTTAAELNRLSQRLMLSQRDPAAIERILRPILSRPEVLLGGLAIVSGLVPLIEELFKPLPVWLLGKRLETPSAGFVVGLLGGAGYALVESLGASSSLDASQWVSVIIGRAGTDLLHILTSGLMGAALVYAWKNGKYLRLILTYLLAVAIHGTWNTISLWAGIDNLILPAGPASIDALKIPSSLSPVGLGLMVLGMLVLLTWTNARLRRADRLRLATASPAEPAAGPTLPSGDVLSSTDLDVTAPLTSDETSTAASPESEETETKRHEPIDPSTESGLNADETPPGNGSTSQPDKPAGNRTHLSL